MAKRRFTEADVAKLPGLVLGENTYSFLSSQGRIHMVGALPLDELFGGEALGILNIRKAHEIIARTRQAPRRLAMDAGLKQNIAKIEYDHKHVKRMTAERRDEPIYMLVSYDGVNVIDGSHRLKRRFRDGLKEVSAYIFRPETLAHLRVTTFRENPDGGRSQINGLTDESLAEHISAAKRIEAEMFGRVHPLDLRRGAKP